MNKHLCSITVALALASLAACGDAPTPNDRRAGNIPIPNVGAGSPTRVPAAKPPAAGQLAADMELSSKVKQALRGPAAGEPPAGYVEVAASDGVVTLNGTVQVPAEKERAALVALEVEGVRSVVNNLVVVRGS